MCTNARIDSIQVLIETTISVNNRLYKQNIKKNTINSIEEQKSSLNQRSKITLKKTTSKNTAI